jgi:WD40 repeat protein
MTEAQNEQTLNTLVRAIALSRGQFSLILVRCNYTTLRKQMLEKLRSQCPIAIRELVLPKTSTTLYTAIATELKEHHPEALMVLGLENVIDLQTLLTSTNQVREEFRKEFAFPLVLWINDAILQKLIKLVPDLESWSTTVEIAIAPEDLLSFLTQTTDAMFDRVIEAGAGRFVDSASLDEEAHLNELTSALEDVRERNVVLEPALNASLEFVLAQNSQLSMAESWAHYERSLQLWQQSHNLERQGCVLFYMGLWWRRYAVSHRAEYKAACTKAKDFFRQCIEGFEQAGRSELAARFINAWGEVLTRLEGVEELEALAQRALPLLQKHSEPIWIAYGYGLLAEVGLRKQDWGGAKRFAEMALATNDQTVADSPNDWSWERNHYRNLYWVLLAKAQRQTGQETEAIALLESAQANGDPQHDPTLYIQILEELRSLYFAQKQYLQAFDVKQAQQAVEQQYGFRAFIGAGRLQPSKLVNNPALAKADGREKVAQEIAASGRQQDVNRLVGRLGRDDQKLIVLHGQSGVGKSSILQAGLVPALDAIVLGARDVAIVLQQVYPNWTRELGQRLLEAIREAKNLDLPEAGDSVPEILKHLRVGVDQNLLIVLIFDQFEEFFFVYKDPAARKPFYEFLRDCLNVPFVKVVLSLREDYLHYLLECNERLISLDVVNNNILDKNILAYLGNFSAADAKAVIEALTRQSQFTMEPKLVDELVRDLAGDLGEVRPIELQVVGRQLQAEGITTLEKFHERGPKERFVERFLDEVVQDCGEEHEQIAKLVLYLLTDENLTRPLKTRGDLEMELDFPKEKLDLVLAILVKSRLVFQIPAVPMDRYQLVHDYLVSFVRQQQSAQLIAEIEKEREKRKLTEAKLTKVLTQQLRTARRATWTLAGLMLAVTSGAMIATVFGVNSYLTSLTVTSAQRYGLDRLVSAIKAGKEFKELSFATLIPDTHLRVIAELNQAVYGVRESTRLEGHTKTVSQVVFSPDGQLIATASEDKTAGIWQQNGMLRAFLKGHTDKVTAVSFSPDSSILATASADRTVRLWKQDGTPLNIILRGHQDSITSISFSPDGKNIVTSSYDRTVKVWSLEGMLLRNYIHKAAVTLVKYSPDGKWIAAASSKGATVELWQVIRNESISIDNYGTISLNFSADGQTLILLNKDQSVNYRSLDGKLLSRFTSSCGRGEDVVFAGLSLNSKLSVFLLRSYYGRRDGISIKQSDESLGCEGGIDGIYHRDRITYVSLSPDNKLLASASKDKTVKLWNLDNVRAGNYIDEQLRVIDHFLLSPDGISRAVRRRGSENNLISPSHYIDKHLPGSDQVLGFSSDGQSLVTSSNEAIVDIWSPNRELVQLPDQHTSIESIYVSPEGSRIVTIAENDSVKLWNRDGKLIKSLTKQGQSIASISFSPDGNVMASIGRDNQLGLWNRNGEHIRTLSDHLKQVNRVVFSPDSQFFASIGADSLLNLYKADGTRITTLVELNRWKDVNFSPDSRLLSAATGSVFADESNDTIKLWHSRDGGLIKTVSGYNFQGVTFSPDGAVVAPLRNNWTFYNRGKTVQLLNLDGTIKTLLDGHQDLITSFSFSPDGQKFFTGGQDQSIRLWRIDGTLIKTLQQHNDAIVSLDSSPNGKTFVSASADNMVKLWSVDGQELKTLQKADKADDSKNDRLRERQPSRVKFSADGKFITFIGKQTEQESIVKIWESDGRELKSFTVRNNSTISSSYRTTIGFSLDQNTVAIANTKNDLKIWDIKGKLLAILQGHTLPINSASFSPDNQTIASASDDGTVKLWNNKGTLIHTFQHSGKVNIVRFSPDGNLLASASDDKTVKLWNLDHTSHRATLQHDDKVNVISFSPDGNSLASASDDKTVKLWNKKGDLIDTLKHDDKVVGVNFSLDGKTLASASIDGTIKVWNSRNRHEITTTQGSPSDSEVKLSFSPNNQILATIGGRGVQLSFPNIWFKDASFTSSFYANDFQFTPDGKAIAVAQGDEVKFLSLDLDTLLVEGCNKVRNYLKTNPNVSEGDRNLCDGIGSQKPKQQ